MHAIAESATHPPSAMAGTMPLMLLLERVAFGVGVVGMAILLWGVGRGVVRFVALELRHQSFELGARARAELRALVGYYLLLGLELLVAADVIETILTPSLEHVLVLGGVVLIRTIISFSLNWELERSAGRESAPPAG